MTEPSGKLADGRQPQGRQPTVSRRQIRYGPSGAQVADLWMPTVREDPLPVVVLVHGGYWRWIYSRRLMKGLAEAVVDLGWAAYNIEYRRSGPLPGGIGWPGRTGGWTGTFDDVAAAVDHLADLDGIDCDRVATCGHSAGGHLALWLAGRGRLPEGAPGADVRVPVCGAVSLAGVVDLIEAAALDLGNGAVRRLMGGLPERYPERYRLASPAAMLPLGVPQVLVHGLADTVVPPSLSEDYQRQAQKAGDTDVVYVPVAGAGHLAMIDPTGAAWAATVSHLIRLLQPGPRNPALDTVE